jgi:hypothetical protein
LAPDGQATIPGAIAAGATWNEPTLGASLPDVRELDIRDNRTQ